MKKKIAIVMLAMVLILPNHIGKADQTEGSERSTEEETVQTTAAGEITAKDEVVYGSLSATGALQEIYVVNMLDVTKPGVIVDYGNYTSIRNLTNLTHIEQVEDSVQFQATPGWFYYQGNMVDAQLPWNIEITYTLDGEEILPEDLPGEEGKLILTIHTSKNENVDSVFFENYTLQISLTLDTEHFRDLQAPDATIAHVGKKRQLIYTVMPDRDGEMSLIADVVNFEMEGIDISAIPLSMAIDDPDIDEMTREMRSLSEAIEEVNHGVFDLKKGVTELNDGVQNLNEGSSDYQLGMKDIKDSSTEIKTASESIQESLNTLSHSLGGSTDEMDVSDMEQLPEGLTLIADGLEEVAEGLTLLKQNYVVAQSALDDAMNDIPAPAVTEEDIQALYASGADHETIAHLVEVYMAAQTAKGTYDQVKEAFATVEGTLNGASEAVHEMSAQLSTIARELSVALEGMEALSGLGELQEGLALLANNYGEFHSGLVSYTAGVSQLSTAYDDINSGFNELAQGTSELESGVSELYEGTDELADATKDLPEQMQEEVNQMLDDYDKSDFEAQSFVSPKNTRINSVQFILRTEAIVIEEEETTMEQEEERPGFWQRLKNLFS